jgi:RNA polymerase sigma-54 factor
MPAAAAARDRRRDEREVARAIITDHLDRLAQHDVNGLARLLKRTPLQIEAACERIRHLSPRPGWNVEPTATQFITPDVIVRKVRGRWTATLNRAVVPRVKLNQTYASMFQEHRDASTASWRSICRRRAGRSRTCSSASRRS